MLGSSPYSPSRNKGSQHWQAQVKAMLAVEMSAGQMVEDVSLAVNGKVPVEHYGRMGGMVPSPEEVVTALENKFIGG